MLTRSALRRLMGQAACAGSLETVYQTALRCVQEGLGVDRAALLLFDDARIMRFVALSGLSDEYRAAVDGHSPWSPDDTSASPLLVPDIEHDAALAPYRHVIIREGIRALAFVPLQVGPRLLGKFMLYYGEPHSFTVDEIDAAQLIADHVALAIENHNVSAALDAQLLAEREIRRQAETEVARRQASERRLHLALAAGRMGTWDWDIASGDVRWSGELEAIHGLATGAFPSTMDAFRRDVHPDDLDRVERAIAAALATPHAEYSVEYRIVREDGSCRWLEARGRVIVDDTGRATGMAGVCCDATERRHAETTRNLLVNQLETLATVNDQIAGALDPSEALQQLAARVVPAFADYCITYIVDDGAIHALGCAHCDPSKNGLVAALAHAAPISFQDEYGPGKVITQGEACVVAEFSPVLAEQRAPGRPHNQSHLALGTCSMMIVPLNARGRTLGAIAFAATDDSGRHFGYEDLRIASELATRTALLVDNARLYAEARAAIRQRDEMMAVVSHDLREPLQSISTALAMLRPEQEHGGSARSIQTIALASTQMRLLVQDLLDISRIDAGQFSIVRDLVDVATLVREAQTLFQAQAEASAVRLECVVAADLPPVSVDRRRILQVLLNLVGNALKFVPAGGAVTIGAEQLADAVRVWVADTGIGIADDHMARVFDRFWSADRRSGGGVGLGLAVSKGIVEVHGGRIDVTSRVGVGSTFQFTLPRASGSSRPVRDRPHDRRVGDRSTVRDDTLVRSRHAANDTGRSEPPQQTRTGHRAKDDALADLAHHIRNLLAPLRTELAILRESSHDPDTVVERCAIMSRQLTQCARLVDDQLGEAEPARSVPHLGDVWLPFGIADEGSPAPSTAADGPIDKRAVANCRVLLVDDNRELAQSMARFLRLLGHEVRIAYDGIEAIQAADDFKPDVALMDIGMPKLNGYEVARRIRATSWGAQMTLIAITGWGRDADRRKAHDAGFDRHMVKPVDAEELAAFLRTCRARQVASATAIRQS